ncbi:MAG: hypothetical protein ABI673_01335 [Novosphingobium sp.]
MIVRNEGQRLSQGRAPVVGWLQSPWTFVLLCVAAALPLAFLDTLPLIDLGGHLGRYAIQIDGGASPVLRQWYSFHWGLLPNLGVDLLVQVLAPIMGLEPAVKLIVVSIPVLQVAGWLLIARAAHGHIPPTALLVLPLAYSAVFHFGFINFNLCAALASLALALWIELGNRNQTALRTAIFVPLSCVLWVCHLAGWAIFCVLAAGVELARLYDKTGNIRDTILRSILPLGALLLPQIIGMIMAPVHSGRGVTVDFFNFSNKLIWIVIVLRDHWQNWDAASAIFLLLAVGGAWHLPHFRLHKGLALGAIFLLVCFVAVPTTLIGSAFADMRLVPTLLAVTLLAARPGADCGRRLLLAVTIAGVAFAGARFAGNGIALARIDRQFTRTLSVLPAVPRDTLLVTVAISRCDISLPWDADRRLHLAGYALARRGAFANDQWVLPGAQLLTVHNPAAGRFVTEPSQDAYEISCRGMESVMQKVTLIPQTTRYMWVYGGTRRFVFPGWHVIRAAGDSVVYQRD